LEHAYIREAPRGRLVSIGQRLVCACQPRHHERSRTRCSGLRSSMVRVQKAVRRLGNGLRVAGNAHTLATKIDGAMRDSGRHRPSHWTCGQSISAASEPNLCQRHSPMGGDGLARIGKGRSYDAKEYLDVDPNCVASDGNDPCRSLSGSCRRGRERLSLDLQCIERLGFHTGLPKDVRCNYSLTKGVSEHYDGPSPKWASTSVTPKAA
jgi:hypothetical protein